jgi:hypothetical protein
MDTKPRSNAGVIDPARSPGDPSWTVPRSRGAFAAIVAEHGDAVTSVAGYFHGPVTAPRATRDAFLALWRTDGILEGAAHLRTTLVSSVHRSSLGTTGPARHVLSPLSRAEGSAIAVVLYGGCSYREAATILGQPETLVRAAIRSGLHRLRVEPATVDATAEAVDARDPGEMAHSPLGTPSACG